MLNKGEANSKGSKSAAGEHKSGRDLLAFLELVISEVMPPLQVIAKQKGDESDAHPGDPNYAHAS